MIADLIPRSGCNIRNHAQPRSLSIRSGQTIAMGGKESANGTGLTSSSSSGPYRSAMRDETVAITADDRVVANIGMKSGAAATILSSVPTTA